MANFRVEPTRSVCTPYFLTYMSVLLLAIAVPVSTKSVVQASASSSSSCSEVTALQNCNCVTEGNQLAKVECNGHPASVVPFFGNFSFKSITIDSSPIKYLAPYSFSGNQISQIEITKCNMESVDKLAFQTKSMSNTTASNTLGSSLVRLSLMRNDLTSLDNGTFEGLINLQYLLLTWNSISKLEDGIFNSLTSLKVVNLQFNSLVSIAASVFRVPSGQPKFYLEYNELTCSCTMAWLREFREQVDMLFPRVTCLDELKVKSDLKCIVYDSKYCFSLESCQDDEKPQVAIANQTTSSMIQETSAMYVTQVSTAPESTSKSVNEENGEGTTVVANQTSQPSEVKQQEEQQQQEGGEVSIPPVDQGTVFATETTGTTPPQTTPEDRTEAPPTTATTSPSPTGPQPVKTLRHTTVSNRVHHANHEHTTPSSQAQLTPKDEKLTTADSGSMTMWIIIIVMVAVVVVVLSAAVIYHTRKGRNP